jgi:hypothetical protein
LNCRNLAKPFGPPSDSLNTISQPSTRCETPHLWNQTSLDWSLKTCHLGTSLPARANHPNHAKETVHANSRGTGLLDGELLLKPSATQVEIASTMERVRHECVGSQPKTCLSFRIHKSHIWIHKSTN